ncbi:MAG TPA: glutamine synthetase, partial [Solirubrobacter sp.]|nr:glutamine synthetase [Solirubrobacter sp.]
GLDGIERALEPPPPRVPGAPLPRDLGAALDRLEADDELVAALGGELVAAFVRLKRSEVERFNAWVSDWELDEYADHL